MKIISAEYVKSFQNIQSYDLPNKASIAFIGRSNVGKSSLINSLLERRKLVKTSSTPGKTQLINYFLINEKFYFIDLPGYGFAKVPKEVRNSWLVMMENFLLRCPELKLICQIVDIRHKPSKEDQEFNLFLKNQNIPHIVIANKLDKLKKSQIPSFLKLIKNTLDLTAHPSSYSSVNGTGRDIVWNILNEKL